MKTFVKLILPVAAFMLASAGAVGTQLALENTDGKLLMTGYVHNASKQECEPVDVDCQIPSTGTLCTIPGPVRQVYRFSTQPYCDTPLWKVIPE